MYQPEIFQQQFFDVFERKNIFKNFSYLETTSLVAFPTASAKKNVAIFFSNFVGKVMLSCGITLFGNI